MKKNKGYSVRFGLALLATCVGLSLSTLAWGDSDEWYEYGHEAHEAGENGFYGRTSDVPVITNAVYKTECSACHFAYQPGLLPERSWVKIMATLDDHFGENAELDAATQSEITDYLRGHAADRLPNRFSRSILRSIGQETPLRITETGYFRHKHREVPARMVTGNDKVRSFSNCLACHSMGDKGVFDEESVRIPGFGYWED
jgi:hypothetical protein